MDIKFFEEIKENDNVGGKGSSLAKMYQRKFQVPNGFVIEASVFDEFLVQNNVKQEIQKIIDNCNIEKEGEIENSSIAIHKILEKCVISDKMKEEIIRNYKKLGCDYVAVRSSATSEDGKSNAWAGQLDTFLNVNEKDIINSVKKCWSSVFSSRAIFYRKKNNDKSDISVAVVVQKMIQSDISGVAFSINPMTNNNEEIVIESVFGLGEAIVSGKVTPDNFIVSKKENIIISKDIKNQEKKLYKEGETDKWQEIKDGNIQSLSDEDVLKLADLIKKIEKEYGYAVDIEWGIENSKIYILQCRPITTVKKNKVNDLIKEIVSKGNWNFYVSRRFNWFVENTEIYASLEEAQKELLGFEIKTQNYLCLNGDEYSVDSDFEGFCHKLNSYFERDICFFDKFAETEFKVVDEIKDYIESLKSKDFGKLSFNELYEEMRKFNYEYIRSFVPGMTRPEDYLMLELEKELKNMKLEENEIQNIFSKVSTCPNYAPLSYSEEPLDLLKIALKLKDGNNVDKLINEHIERYSWIKAPVEFEDTAFTRKDYEERLDNLRDANINEKIDNILRIRHNNDVQYEKVLEEYKFSERTKKLIKGIRDFIFLRTYTTEYSDHLFYEARHTIFKEISKRCGLEVCDLIMLDDKEILNILENKGDIKDEIKNILEERKKGFAMIWIEGNVKTVFGNDSLELQACIANKYKKSDEQETGKKVISGTVANMGKVQGIARILLKYEDIYKVQKGDIIIATMTTPDYISAMEKASGFVTDEGGVTCHAAILSREFDVPCIVGTINATKEIKDGELIELDGYNGKVYVIEQ